MTVSYVIHYIKTIVKSFAMAVAIGALLLLTDCANPARSNMNAIPDGQSVQDTTMQQGACPMHPAVNGKIGDTCPKCGMKLEAVNGEKEEYSMDFHVVAEVRAGETSILSFTPSMKGKTDVVALDIQHGKKIHLIIVSEDLSYFDHVHPEIQADGSYQIRALANGTAYTKGKFNDETRFEQGGEYVLFADYKPTGADHQVERIELKVTGATWPVQKYTFEKLVSAVDGFDVSLTSEDGQFYSEGNTSMAAIFKKNGKEIPADQLEDFLEAKAHVVMISEEAKNYLHVHPEVAKGRLALHTTFGLPGMFRGWLQFKTNGQVHTADFVIKVVQGKAPQHGAQKHKH